MRLLFTAFLLIVASNAHAQILACKSISDNKDRLSCYDKAANAPPPTAKAPTGKFVDETANEDERMKKLLKPICKNC